MKNSLKYIVTMLIAAFFCINATAQDKKLKKNEAEVTFVTTIDCKSCLKKCDANLPYQKGVKDYKSNLEAKTIYFKYDQTKTDKESLKKAIEKLGYEAAEKETTK